MSQRRHLTAVAAGATLLASMPLSGIFERWTWLVAATLVVAAASGAAMLARSPRAPAWVPTVAAVIGYLLALCWRFPSGQEFAGLVPVPATFSHWASLLQTAGAEVRELSIPVADHDGLLFLVAAGIGAVGILVDLFAVVLRRPALAGLPMLAIYSVPVAVQIDSVSVVPFAAGAAGFLWLLATHSVDRVRRFGRRFTADGRDVDLWEPSPLASAGRRLAAAGVLVAVLVPLAVPGMTSGLLDRFGTGNGIGPGTGRGSVTVNLYAQLRGILSQDRPYEMVRATTDDPDPFYLRFGVAGDVSDAGFRARPPTSGQPVTAGIAAPTITSTAGVRQSAFHAKVQVVNLDMGLLPVYLQPTRTEKLDSSWLYDRSGQTIYSNRSSSKKKTYLFDFVRTEFTAAALRTAQPLDRDQFAQTYTALPRRYDEVDAIVDPLVAAQNNQYDRVMAILDYFSPKNGFVYSLKTETGTSGSPIVDFLQTKKGFCEQYSAAMAWLVRAAGIPARVAFGFTRGRSVAGDTYSMTNENLHAWTEVYFNGFGWVPFDPTPAVSVPGSVLPLWQRPEVQQSNGSASGSDDPRRGQLPDSATSGGANRPPDPNPFAGPATVARPNPLTQWRFWVLAGVLAVLVSLLAPPLARAGLRRRRWPDRLASEAAAGGPMIEVAESPADLTDPPAHAPGDAEARRRAHAAWDELIDTMVDHRLPPDPAATPRVIAERLVTQGWLGSATADSARLLGHAEERARYARRPLPGGELGTALRAVRREIPRRTSRRTRLIAVLMPPSVLRRWRAAARDRIIATAAGIAKLRDRAVRVVRPRRALAGGS